MGASDWPQPPKNEKDLGNYLDNTHEIVFGQENTGGTLDGKNITNITDPEDTTDVSDAAVKLNLLFAELRTLGLM